MHSTTTASSPERPYEKKKKPPRKVQTLVELLVVVAALEEAVHYHFPVVLVPHLSWKVHQVLLDLRRVEGALDPKQLQQNQHRRLERPVVFVVLVVVAERHQDEQLLRAAGRHRPAEKRQERLIMVGQRALRNEQHAVVPCVLVQHNPLFALGVPAPVHVLHAAQQDAVRTTP